MNIVNRLVNRLLPLGIAGMLAACGGAAPTATIAPTAVPTLAPPTSAPPTLPPAPPASPQAATPPARPTLSAERPTQSPAVATQAAAILATINSPGAIQTAAAIARVTPVAGVNCDALLTPAELQTALGAPATRETSAAVIAAVSASRPEFRGACIWNALATRKNLLLVIISVAAARARDPNFDAAPIAGSSSVTGTVFTPIPGLGDRANWITIAARPDAGLLVFFRGDYGLTLSGSAVDLPRHELLSRAALSENEDGDSV